MRYIKLFMPAFSLKCTLLSKAKSKNKCVLGHLTLPKFTGAT